MNISAPLQRMRQQTPATEAQAEFTSAVRAGVGGNHLDKADS